MNSNENIKYGDRIEKTVVKGYSTGEETHIETYEVDGFEVVGRKQVLWAVGRIVDSTDTRDSRIGKRGFIQPVGA